MASVNSPIVLVGLASPENPFVLVLAGGVYSPPCPGSSAEAWSGIKHLLGWSVMEQHRQNKERKNRNNGQERQGRVLPHAMHPSPSLSSKLLNLPICLKTDHTPGPCHLPHRALHPVQTRTALWLRWCPSAGHWPVPWPPSLRRRLG